MSIYYRIRRARALGAILTAGTVCQFGGCDIGEITTTSTVDGRQLLISLVRGAILAPLDAFITSTINDALGGDE